MAPLESPSKSTSEKCMLNAKIWASIFDQHAPKNGFWEPPKGHFFAKKVHHWTQKRISHHMSHEPVYFSKIRVFLTTLVNSTVRRMTIVALILNAYSFPRNKLFQSSYHIHFCTVINLHNQVFQSLRALTIIPIPCSRNPVAIRSGTISNRRSNPILRI